MEGQSCPGATQIGELAQSDRTQARPSARSGWNDIGEEQGHLGADTEGVTAGHGRRRRNRMEASRAKWRGYDVSSCRTRKLGEGRCGRNGGEFD